MELWKSIRELEETVHAALPDTGAGTVRHRSAGGTFRVYQPFHDEGRPYLGSAEVELGTDEIKPSSDRWKSALREAGQVRDPWYPLEITSSALQPSRTSTLEKQELERWVEPLADIVARTLKSEPVLPLREHLQLTKRTVQYRDSFGRELEELRFSASLEVFLVPKEDPQAHPFVAEFHFSEYSPDVLAGFVREQARLTLDAYQAKAWFPEGRFHLLLRGPALAAAFDFLLAQVGAPAVAAGYSEARVHQPLWNGPGSDPLTVTALAELYNSPESGGFDNEGLVLETQTLVRDGIVRELWSTQATAHWLGARLTGRPRNFSVSPGSQSREALSALRVLEIHRLRWAQVDPATGDFSVEVGLADLHDGGKRTPVFGFSLHGNLREVLTNARFSSDVGSWEHYEGPEFLVVSSEFLRSS